MIGKLKTFAIWSRNDAYGTFMGSWSVRESTILIAATSSGSSALAPFPGLLGSTMRLSEKTTSAGVTGLPL